MSKTRDRISEKFERSGGGMVGGDNTIPACPWKRGDYSQYKCVETPYNIAKFWNKDTTPASKKDYLEKYLYKGGLMSLGWEYFPQQLRRLWFFGIIQSFHYLKRCMIMSVAYCFIYGKSPT